jgi:hypothetical protein
MFERRHNAHGDHSAVATRLLPAGRVVIPDWHDRFWRALPGWRELAVEEVVRLPERQQQLFFRYGTDVDFGRVAGPTHPRFITTPDNYINHSCDPNLLYDTRGNVIAGRDIAAGEELFVDYGFFCVNWDERFVCRCGSARCRGRVTREDWKELVRRHGYRCPRFLHPRIPEVLAARAYHPG